MVVTGRVDIKNDLKKTLKNDIGSDREKQQGGQAFQQEGTTWQKAVGY